MERTVPFIALEEEQIAEKKYGIKETEKKRRNFISRFFDYQENRREQCLDRKKYLWLAVLTGWMGGHRFYAKQYFTAMLYLLFFWTGIPIAMTLIDLMIALPKEADENGHILL